MRPSETRSGWLKIEPDTRPRELRKWFAQTNEPAGIQFREPLSERVRSDVVKAMTEHPEMELYLYGDAIDPDLAGLKGFEFLRKLSINVWTVTSFERLSEFSELRELSLGRTKSHRPSLESLRMMPQLRDLWIEGHEKDFDAVSELKHLHWLGLHTPRIKSLEALSHHPTLELLDVSFGGIRNLGPLTSLPRLRGLELFQIRLLDTGDLEVVGDLEHLEVLSLGALRNVHGLRMLARGPARTLRYLILEKITGLSTLSDLTECTALEELGLYESKPRDACLDSLLLCPSLQALVVGDVYPDQVDIMRRDFCGRTLTIRGEEIRGSLNDVRVRWRSSLKNCLRIDEI